MKFRYWTSNTKRVVFKQSWCQIRLVTLYGYFKIFSWFLVFPFPFPFSWRKSHSYSFLHSFQLLPVGPPIWKCSIWQHCVHFSIGFFNSSILRFLTGYIVARMSMRNAITIQIVVTLITSLLTHWLAANIFIASRFRSSLQGFHEKEKKNVENRRIHFLRRENKRNIALFSQSSSSLRFLPYSNKINV